LNEARDLRFRNLAFRRHAVDLELRGRWSDIRIEPDAEVVTISTGMGCQDSRLAVWPRLH